MIMSMNPMNGIRAVIKGTPEKTAVCSPEEDPHQNLTVLTPDLELLAPRNVRK